MKKRIMFLCMSIWGFCLAGCGERLPEMTQEQEDAIVEYMASAVVRHINDYGSRLVDLSLYAVKEPEVKPEPVGMDKTADTETVDLTDGQGLSGDGTAAGYSITQLLMPEGVELTYTGYKVTDSYPEDQSDSPFFALDASDGKRLLILCFNVVNTTSERTQVDVFTQAPRFTVTVNGNVQANSLPTMLLDDLGTYIGYLSGGEEIELVVLTEIDEATAENIATMRLVIETDAGTSAISLQ